VRFILLILLMAVPAFGQPASFEEVTAFEAGMMEPSPPAERAIALELLSLGSTDRFIEIGCGDGRVLVEAMVTAPDSATAVGVEINPAVAAAARLRVEHEGLSDRVDVATADARLIDMSAFTAAYVYLGGYEDLTRELAPKLVGKRVVSIGHKIPTLAGGEQFGNVWYYRKAKLEQATTAAATAKPVSGSKPVLTIVMAPSNIYCPACELLKADIAAGKLSQFEIQYSATLLGRSYPEVQYVTSTGNTAWVSGWPAWSVVSSAAVSQVESVQASAASPVVARRSNSATWTYGGRSYSLSNYRPCGWRGCPMCNKWRRLTGSQ
jgi:SAM-dependent methyltransferase